jgi:hypothetical protein
MTSRKMLATATVLVLVVAGVFALVLHRNHPPAPAAPAGTSGVTATTAPPVSAKPSALPGPTGAGGIALGVYVKPVEGGGSSEAALGQFASAIHRRLAIVQTFTGWETAGGAPVPFPAAFVSYAETEGATPMVTWQPEQAVGGGGTGAGLLSDQPDFSLDQLSSGRYDPYIRSWAEAAKAFGHVVYVRLMHEMNDKTYPWSIGVNGNMNAQQYITAWRHIVGIFQSVGASNVQFVWCVGAKPTQPNPAAYFPGDGYVSWIALDGYNRGRPWQSFTSVFSVAYGEVTAVSTLPVMIAETASVESPDDPGAKAAWITSAFDQEIPQNFPRVRAVLYFDAPGRGFSYSLSSSPAAQQAFAQVAASPLYQGTGPG